MNDHGKIGATLSREGCCSECLPNNNETYMMNASMSSELITKEMESASLCRSDASIASPKTTTRTLRSVNINKRKGKHSIRNRKRLPQSYSAMRLFLISCSCFYLLSESNGVTVEDGEGNGRKSFLRTAVAAAAPEGALNTLTEPSPPEILAGNTEEEYDYESYHATHNIPVPALSTTMMGMQHNGRSRMKNND
eukprot:scaffold8523_cov81-Skeletonema_marinoi.AAC.1